MKAEAYDANLLELTQGQAGQDQEGGGAVDRGDQRTALGPPGQVFCPFSSAANRDNMFYSFALT